MAAVIKCEQTQKQEVKEFIQTGLADQLDFVDLGADEKEDVFSVTETEDGLSVEYPIDEVYGLAARYVDGVLELFEELKKKYPTIEIWGIVCEYESCSCSSYGYLFRCKSTDKRLKSTADWQLCVQCGAYIEGNAAYNSVRHDFGDGDENCLCSPTCMLEYALDFTHRDLNGNASLSEEECEQVQEDIEGAGGLFLKRILWERIVSSMHRKKFIKDFAMKKERIQKLVESENVDDEKKEVLKKILSLVEWRLGTESIL